MVKYAAAAAAALVLAVTVAAAVAAEQTAAPSAEQQPQKQPLQQNSGAEDGGVSWTEVIACYKKPQMAIGCLESRMSRAMMSMRDTAVGLAHSDPDAAVEDVARVGDLVQQIGEFITYGMSSYFRGGSVDEDETAAQSAGGSPVNSQKDLDEGEFLSPILLLLFIILLLLSYTNILVIARTTVCRIMLVYHHDTREPNSVIMLRRTVLPRTPDCPAVFFSSFFHSSSNRCGYRYSINYYYVSIVSM